jgi:tetratricopeptide (TPR) repeat protein
LKEEYDLLIYTALHDPDKSVRTWAARTLRAYTDPDLVESIEAALRSPVSNERIAAAEALGVLKDPQAGASLTDALRDSNVAVSIAAALALMALQDDDRLASATNTLVAHLKAHHGGFDRVQAAAGLLGASPDAARKLEADLLQAVAMSPDVPSSVRERAFDACGGWESGSFAEACAACDSGDFRDAIAGFTTIIDGRKEAGLPYFQRVALWYRGLSYVAESNIEAGIKDMDESGLSDFDSEHRVKFAQVLLDSGRRKQIRELCDSFPLDSEEYYVQGYIAYLAGDYSTALQALKRAIAGQDQEVTLSAALYIVLISVAQGQIEQAEQALDEAVHYYEEIESGSREEILRDFNQELTDGVQRGWIAEEASNRVQVRLRRYT